MAFIPMLSAMSMLQQKQASEDARKRQLAEMAQPEMMPSRQRPTPSYADAMNVSGPTRATGGGADDTRVRQAGSSGAAGARQASGTMTGPQPAQQALANASPNAAFQRTNPYTTPDPRPGYAPPMARPEQAAMQPQQMRMMAQNAGAMTAANPMRAGGVQAVEPEDTTMSDAAALGLGVGGQALSKQAQDAAIRRQAMSGIAQQQARSLGAPTYGVQAAEARRAMQDNGGMNYLSPLLDYYRTRGLR